MHYTIHRKHLELKSIFKIGHFSSAFKFTSNLKHKDDRSFGVIWAVTGRGRKSNPYMRFYGYWTLPEVKPRSLQFNSVKVWSKVSQ